MTNCNCIVGDVETPEPLKCRCHDVALVDGRYEHATVVVEAGCITSVEAGEIPLYTPNVCCAGTGGGGTGAQGRPGDKGDPGENATITIGAVNTLAPGSKATVVNVGSATNAVLEFGIPAGASGESGASSSGVTSDVAGFSVENGSVISLPTAWPPIMYVMTETTDTNVTLTAEKNDSNGILTLSLDLANFNTALKKYSDDTLTAAKTDLQNQINTINNSINAINSSIAALKAAIDRLS